MLALQPVDWGRMCLGLKQRQGVICDRLFNKDDHHVTGLQLVGGGGHSDKFLATDGRDEAAFREREFGDGRLARFNTLFDLEFVDQNVSAGQ